MLREIVHPIHYVLGVLTHAPQLFGLWVKEPNSIKASFGVFYLLVFVAIGAATGGMSPAFISFFVLMYGIMLSLLSVPQMFFDTRKGGFLYRFSQAFLNSTLVFHGYFVAHSILVGLFSFVAWKVGMDPLSLIRSIICMTSGIAALYAFQMAESRFNHVRPWMVVTAATCIVLLLYIGTTVSMNAAMDNLIETGAYRS